MRPRLVLVHPRNADNLVSIAGAMKHFGLTDWVVVSSAAHLEGMKAVLVNHRPPNEFTAPVLAVRRVETLAEAIADCSWVVGTTMRTLEGRPRLTPRQLVQLSLERRDRWWAMVFGSECNGLRNDEVEQCHAVSFIPCSEEQPSLNLSQAVVVYAHELASVEHGAAPDGLADDATLRALRASMVAGMVASGVLRKARSSSSDVDALLASLIRGSLTHVEALRWGAAWKSRG